MIGVIFILAVMVGLVFSGIVNIRQTDLTFTTSSLEALYDGTPLTKHDCYMTKGRLKDGHTLQIEYKGSQTDVGESDNVVEVRILDQLGADVTSDYNITYDFGTLKVNPRVITITSSDAEKVYDGKPLRDNTYTLTSEHKGLVTGHTANVVISGEITNAGAVTNTVKSVKVYDDAGKDVTGNYQIMTREGILQVDPIPVMITSASALKVYDGEPLSAETYQLSDMLLDGHREFVKITGSLTEVGETLNTIEFVQITDKWGNDHTENYQILCNEGVLKVMEPPEGSGADGTGSGSGTGSGGGGSSTGTGSGTGSGGGGGGGGSGGGEGEEVKDVIYSILANTSGAVYLRIQSYGDYTGTGWNVAEPYSALINDKYAASYLPSFALEAIGSKVLRADIVTHNMPYAMPYYLSPQTEIIQLDDTVAQGGDKDGYTALFFEYDELMLQEKTLNKAFERSYRTYVSKEYLSIDNETRAYMQSIILEQGFKKSDPDIINKVAQYIQQAATYNLEFDPALEQSENIAIAFLDQYKEGVCRHYATAATLLYRALGIPARYTVGALAKAVEGKWVDVTSKEMHAWVEVYVNGIGWIYVEVTGSLPGAEGDLVVGAGGGIMDHPGSEPGEGEGEGEGENGPGGNETYPKKPLTLSPTTVQKKYDAKPLYSDGQLSGFGELAKIGYTYQAVVKGSRTEVGVSASSIVSVSIFDSLGNDVTNSFDLTLKEGKIHVYAQALRFESPSYTTVYTGASFKTGKLVEGSLLSGHSIRIIPTASVSVGVQSNSFNVEIIDSNGNDVSDYYYIDKDYGDVNVQPIALVLKAGDATKKYDGTPLTSNECIFVEGKLLAGHRLVSCFTAGSQTEIGRSENVIRTVKIVDGKGNDMTSNYSIDFLPGKLRVTAQ